MKRKAILIKKIVSGIAPAIVLAAACTLTLPTTTIAQAPPGNDTCILQAISPGALAPNPQATVLNSRRNGGRSGSIQAHATRAGYTITIQGPNGFTTAPIGGDDDVKFRTRYSMRRATRAFRVPSRISTPLNRGRTEIEIDVRAKKRSGAFTSGVYATNVLVRCE